MLAKTASVVAAPGKRLNPCTSTARTRSSAARGVPGISGHGRYHLDSLFVAARHANGTCSHSKEPVGFQLVIRASGPVQR